MKILRIVLILIVAVWMGFIFYMSSQNADISNEASGRAVRFVEKVFFPDWAELPAEEYELRHLPLTYLVRKMAHFTEFFLLGVFLSLVFLTFRIPWKFRFLPAFLIGVLYAVSDEWHQTFVDGRAMEAFDVLIDSGGVFLGVLAALGIAAMIWSGAHAVREDLLPESS